MGKNANKVTKKNEAAEEGLLLIQACNPAIKNRKRSNHGHFR